MTYNFNEIRIHEGGENFILIDEDAKVFVITDLEKANTLTDFETTNEWVEDAADIYINDLSSYINEKVEMFGYTQLDEEEV